MDVTGQVLDSAAWSCSRVLLRVNPIIVFLWVGVPVLKQYWVVRRWGRISVPLRENLLRCVCTANRCIRISSPGLEGDLAHRTR